MATASTLASRQTATARLPQFGAPVTAGYLLTRMLGQFVSYYGYGVSALLPCNIIGGMGTGLVNK